VWVALAGMAGAASSLSARPENVFLPPKSSVVPSGNAASISLEFAYNDAQTNSEPSASDYPMVYWYMNGNYVAAVQSTLKQKKTDILGIWYQCYDPYGDVPNGPSTGFGKLYPAEWPDGKPTGRRQIVWQNTFKIPLGTPTAVYYAYIPSIGVYTVPAQISVTPSADPGSSASLEIVRSPESYSRQPGGAVTMWGDARSNVTGLLRNPFGVGIDYQGMIYVADTLNHGIRRITPGGTGSTVAGLDGGILDSKGTALTRTNFYDPVTGTVTGNIVVGKAEDGTVSNTAVLRLNSISGLATGSRLTYTSGLLLNPGGLEGGTIPTTLVCGSIFSSGIVQVSGFVNATAQSGTLTFNIQDAAGPRSVYKERPPVSGAPTLDTVDQLTNQSASEPSSYRFEPKTENISGEPLFNSPEGLAAADDGSIFVADTENNAIRKIYYDENHATHVRTLVIGSLALQGNESWSTPSYSNSAKLNKPNLDLQAPRGIVFDSMSSMKGLPGKTAPVLYVLDFTSIKKITLNAAENGIPAGSYVKNVAYIGSVSQAAGFQSSGEAARLYAPRGLVVTSENAGAVPVLYVADTVSHVIRKLSLPTS